MTRRLSFLPAFFLVLGVFFAVAVFLRVRAYQTAAELQPALGTSVATTQSVAAEEITDTGEIVEMNPDGTTMSPRDRTAAQLAREQRYNELLRAAPPAAAPPKQEQSLFQKIVTPIANALGVREKKPVPPPPVRQAPPVRPTPQQQQAQNNNNAQDRTNSNDPNVDPEGPKDEDSDTKAPQLMGLEFSPTQVADGAETMLIMTVIDDLSGVRSVSGVIASPAGALQGFAGQREAPESNRYVARIQIPAEATAGTWRINYLALSDNAGNSVNLSASQGLLPGTAQFRVNSAQSDAQGPTLLGVRVEKPDMRAGEKNTIYVEASDDKSGVSLASGVFVSPSKHARLGFGCRPGAVGGSLWECDFTPAANVECGDWQLEQIQLQDKARNMASYRSEVPMVRGVQVHITGQGCDNTPPTLVSLTLNPLVVSNAEGGVIQVQAQVNDDMSGVAHINAQAYGPTGPGGAKVSFSLSSPDQGQTWIGNINVAKNAPSGTWSVGWVQVIDKAQNLRQYSVNDPVLANVKFLVE
ncbi:MAG TPA: hypothetical protein VGF48_00775 [Thermoanaerobaculia bacterium]